MLGGAKAAHWKGSGTASIVSLRPMLRFARARGVDTAEVLREIGVSPAKLDEYDYRIPETSRFHAWVAVPELAHDGAFGLHVAEQATIGAFDALDYALYFSSTLGEAFGRLLQFHRVLSDAWAVRLESEGGVARLSRVERTPPHEVEAFMTVMVVRARELTGHDVAPREVRFAHVAPADTRPHAAIFRAPVRFGCAMSELALSADDLALPVKTSNPGVEQILERYLKELVGRLPKNDSFVERVRAVVTQALLDGRPTLATVARRLHASPRTVQRRLEEHATSFAEIVGSVRRELAERLVKEKRMSITEIAFLLGFADLSGFRRMYKRWTGVAPSRERSYV
ncbi:MAG: AraC family transcriptional regulator [Polyangiaceae bacterium]